MGDTSGPLKLAQYEFFEAPGDVAAHLYSLTLPTASSYRDALARNKFDIDDDISYGDYFGKLGASDAFVAALEGVDANALMFKKASELYAMKESTRVLRALESLVAALFERMYDTPEALKEYLERMERESEVARINMGEAIEDAGVQVCAESESAEWLAMGMGHVCDAANALLGLD